MMKHSLLLVLCAVGAQGSPHRQATDLTFVENIRPAVTLTSVTVDTLAFPSNTGVLFTTETPANLPDGTTGPVGEIKISTDGVVSREETSDIVPSIEPSGDVVDSTSLVEKQSDTTSVLKKSTVVVADTTSDGFSLPFMSETAGTGPEEPSQSASGHTQVGDQIPTTTDQIQDDAPNETTIPGLGTSATDTTTSSQPIEDMTSQPAADRSDTAVVDVPSNIDAPSTTMGVTTAPAATATNGDNTVPFTTSRNVEITGIPVPAKTTTRSDVPIPTVTEAPEGFDHTTVGDHPEWTSNTWITTTSDDSSEPTIVPVLVGCKQCGGRGSGIVLWNFPKTLDTWFQLPGLPKFTFPCIPPACDSPPTVSEENTDRENGDDDGDDEEEDDEDDEEPSSTSCTGRATVTDCFVACTTYTGTAGATLSPECSTSCAATTATGCSATGATSTSSIAACGPSGDSSCSICSRRLKAEAEADTNELEERGLDLHKREAGDKGIPQCPDLTIPPTFPLYPGGGFMLKNDAEIDAKNSPLNRIKRWWQTTVNAQCSPVLSSGIDEAEFLRRSAHLTKTNPSVDHVYEKSMLLDYFKAIINKNGKAVKGATSGRPRTHINCQDLQAYGGVTRNGKTLLQGVFDAFPGWTYNDEDPVMPKEYQYFEDFLGMDQWTNGDAKGKVASPTVIKERGKKLGGTPITPNTAESDASTWFEAKVDWLERMAIGVEMFSAPEAIDAMIRQNTRIYARLMDIDNEAKGCMNDPAVQNGLWSFAGSYKKFMETRFNGQDAWSINNEVKIAKTNIIKRLELDFTEGPNIQVVNADEWAGKLASWKARFDYIRERQFAVPEPAWVWDLVEKRDGDDSGVSCKRPLPDATTSLESTTFATTTRATSDDFSDSSTDSQELTTFATSAKTSSEEASSDGTTTSHDEATTSSHKTTSAGFPSLTNAPALSISTPDGSSCASTATYTLCNAGSGPRGGACVTNSQCASWVNTKTTSTTRPPGPTLPSPDPNQNVKHCFKSGKKADHSVMNAIAESFCRDVVNYRKDNGYYWSNDKLDTKKVPGTTNSYHFKVYFEVKRMCLWKADFDDCIGYMKIPIDECDGSTQGGWVENNCLIARIDPNSGV